MSNMCRLRKLVSCMGDFYSLEVLFKYITNILFHVFILIKYVFLFFLTKVSHKIKILNFFNMNYLSFKK